MANRVTVDINTRALTDDMERRGGMGDRELLRIARTVERNAKLLAPVDTGRLRSSITLDGPRTRRGGLTYLVTANVDYSTYVHEGTRYMRGRPFLVDALYRARI